jgi:hypothetical protein
MFIFLPCQLHESSILFFLVLSTTDNNGVLPLSFWDLRPPPQGGNRHPSPRRRKPQPPPRRFPSPDQPSMASPSPDQLFSGQPLFTAPSITFKLRPPPFCILPSANTMNHPTPRRSPFTILRSNTKQPSSISCFPSIRRSSPNRPPSPASRATPSNLASAGHVKSGQPLHGCSGDLPKSTISSGRSVQASSTMVCRASFLCT